VCHNDVVTKERIKDIKNKIFDPKSPVRISRFIRGEKLKRSILISEQADLFIRGNLTPLGFGSCSEGVSPHERLPHFILYTSPVTFS
jgi:hypothetical protein